nr:MAG TPA: pentapeptide repeat protein [Caudoviricetes sp.]
MKGYKAFLSDMTTRHGDDTVYEVGKTYTVEGEIKICENGYHFCKKCVDVYDYYSKPCRICEVSVTGAVQTQGNKSVGRRLKILRELTADEISSLCNSGDCNSGDCNSGNCNSGNWNSGNRNSGDWNSGNWNSGDWNSGDWNSGYWNSGNRNSGDCNSGDCNSGNCNSGNWNSGYCNTTEPTVRLFDHQTDITFSNFKWSRAYGLLCHIPSDRLNWKYSEYMTDDEKAAHPEHETTGGFLYLEKADRQAWWESLSDESKAAITSMPYFDADKFYKCTNIRVEKQC